MLYRIGKGAESGISCCGFYLCAFFLSDVSSFISNVLAVGRNVTSFFKIAMPTAYKIYLLKSS